ncbi:mitochondrial thiamine pyrophosphate carrier-like [Uranotaenia lowii]|uniref:mitochondrial thiamine pyrophosphate carrier-like n=1 Tax=Uranotaenia lowii TaxID=190385 RepID=UPI002478B74C|nr:mitochondrial thiamine pyrophosphate carrier-like [Uranotaenia lowii]
MDRPKEEHVKFVSLAGGLTGCITRVVVQPFDVLKIRLQLQVEPIYAKSVASKYRTIPQSVGLIFREEGISAFWKGHNPAQMLSMVYGVTQFTSYEWANEQLRQLSMFEGHDRARNFAGGAFSGTFSALFVMPFDVIKTRLISQDPKGASGYTSSWHAARHIYVTEGLRGLYRGFGPALLHMAPLTGGQYLFYNLFGNIFKEVEHLPPNECLSTTRLLLCGALAGICTKTIVYPFDLIKCRLQIQNFYQARKTFGEHFVCTHMLQCLVKVGQREGLFGLYKGLSSSLVKATVASSIYFTVYDQLLCILNKKI